MHLNMSYSEVKNLPIRYRHWYLNRLAKHFRDKNKSYEESKSTNSASNNNNNDLNKFEQFQAQVNNKLN